MDKHQLVQDESTSWNSTLYTLQSIYTQKMALAAHYATEYDSITGIFRRMIAILEPVEEVTKLISAEMAEILENSLMISVLWEKSKEW